MLIKNIIDEDFINYKKPCMFISTCFCDWKCCKEANIPITVCQNYNINGDDNISIKISDIYKRYISNPISKAIVIGGLEPLKQNDDLLDLIQYFRQKKCFDDIVIYTGYNEDEISDFILLTKKRFTNIYIKFGRFVPNQQIHYDEILGVNLSSDNQRGVKIC